MPGGSKKGERRGGKRAGAGQMSAPKAPRAPRPANVDVLGIRKPRGDGGRGPSKSTEAYYREVVKAVNGHRANATAARREPRELMLKTMAYFEDLGDQHVEMATWLLGQLKTLSPAQLLEYEVQMDMVERRIREYYLLATDVAYKCAPYVHARLSAVQVTGANQGPIEVVGMLLKEIDEANRGRPTWAPPDLKLVSDG